MTDSTSASGSTLGPTPRWRRYVALGDSFTEGLEDLGDGRPPGSAARPGGTDEVYVGWADRLAAMLSERAEQPMEYANLAVRGRLLPQIVAEQVPVAVAAEPDLVSLVGGGNDVLRPSVDIDRLAALLDDAVVRLRAAGADVLLATPVDPVASPLIRRTRGRAATYGCAIWSIARRHGAHVLDLWGMRSLQDRRMWAPDRIHLTAQGHHRVALHALDALGVGAHEDWATPLPPAPPAPRSQAAREDAEWLRTHVGPWAARRLRGRSSGDEVSAKRPHPRPWGD